MRSHKAFSTSVTSDQQSPLVAAFVQRLGGTFASARQIIGEQVLALQREVTRRGSPDVLLESAKIRGIVSIEKHKGLNSDGFIEPLGSSSAEGFRVVLREEATSNRQRFTLAHEICHTFFYEVAPEIKFSDCRVDSTEEALCNLGAACLLMPETVLRESEATARPCLSSLETLSEQFSVSCETMILRLRSLGLWKCEYTRWYRMTSGEFTLDRLYGWKRIAWSWSNPTVLQKAWNSGRLHRGAASLWGETVSGDSTAKRVHYEVKRRGDVLTALWDERRLFEETPPLLTKHPNRLNQNRRRKGMRVLAPNITRPARYWWVE